MKYAVAYKEGEILATFQYESWAQEWKDKHCDTCVVVALSNSVLNAQASVVKSVKEGERIYSKEDMEKLLEFILTRDPYPEDYTYSEMVQLYLNQKSNQ